MIDRPHESIDILISQVEKISGTHQQLIASNLRDAYSTVSNGKKAKYWFGRYV
jgi:hypothetical protein